MCFLFVFVIFLTVIIYYLLVKIFYFVNNVGKDSNAIDLKATPWNEYSSYIYYHRNRCLYETAWEGESDWNSEYEISEFGKKQSEIRKAWRKYLRRLVYVCLNTYIY